MSILTGGGERAGVLAVLKTLPSPETTTSAPSWSLSRQRLLAEFGLSCICGKDRVSCQGQVLLKLGRCSDCSQSGTVSTIILVLCGHLPGPEKRPVGTLYHSVTQSPWLRLLGPLKDRLYASVHKYCAVCLPCPASLSTRCSCPSSRGAVAHCPQCPVSGLYTPGLRCLYT